MTKPCGRTVPTGQGAMTSNPLDFKSYCTYPRMKGKQQCVWHWLFKQPAAVQASYAAQRKGQRLGTPEIARVPKEEGPPGERWCSGCQSFVPLFYVSGSRCKSCNSEAAHAGRVEKTYGISKAEYEDLFRLQGGRCFICQRESKSRRLAVDHDHVTGAVRGLLCPDPDRGCNHAILGNIRDVPMARRILLYLARTPYERLQGKPALSWADYVKQEALRLAEEATQARIDPPVPPPPF